MTPSLRFGRARRPIASLGCLVGLACGPADVTPPAGPESLLVITLDTTRADHLGAYGNPLPITPHLDALAARGVVFENAYAPMPQTLSSHATLFSGLDPRLHGALENSYVLPDEIVTLAETLQAAGHRTAGVIAALVLSPATGIAQGFDTFDRPDHEQYRAVERVVRRPARAVTDAALAWADGVTPAEPYFLWAHYYDPHHPLEPPPEALAQIERAAVVEWLQERPRELRPGKRSLKNVTDYWHGYAAEVRGMDEQVGRLLAGLDARGLLAQTTVVVIGDHGEGLYEHGLAGHGLLLYEEQVRVPLFVVRPGGEAAGRRVAELVSSADVMPTLLELLLGRASDETLTGRSFAEVFAAGGVPAGHPVFVERPHYSKQRLRRRAGKRKKDRFRWGVMAAVIDDGFKLIREPGQPDALYDLARDPEEIEDVAAAKPETLARLQQRLDAWLAAHPVGEPGSGVEIAPEQLEALRALGYLDADDD